MTLSNLCLSLRLMRKEEIDFLYTAIGQKIRGARAQAKFTQQQLADKLELSRVSVVNIEKGRQHPSIHILVDISRTLNEPLIQLLSDSIINGHITKINKDKVKRRSKHTSEADQSKILDFIMQAQSL